MNTIGLFLKDPLLNKYGLIYGFSHFRVSLREFIRIDPTSTNSYSIKFQLPTINVSHALLYKDETEESPFYLPEIQVPQFSVLAVAMPPESVKKKLEDLARITAASTILSS